ncbi:DUF654-domain-containing protein [Lichtheimia hyalospora FSU 10163]|nr:DUF654-domain-containing protein [Lichtheimia hyalospora FSU 10163]
MKTSNKKKGKKKNKKAKAKTTDVSEMTMEELDQALKEVTADGSATTAMGDDLEKNTHERREFLSVNYRHLDAEAEMKRMFGSRVVNKESRTAGRVLKRSKMTTPKVDWPPYKKQGLSMELIKTTSNQISYFAFNHDDEYQDAQLEFLNGVAMHDPNALMALLARHPYHIDCLLQVSEMAKQSGDWSVAGDFVERALYACERAFHPHFAFSSGTARLSYQRSENRSFFLAIFRHIQFLARRGCWRTAFEFNKLLFSLDPEGDPLGALLSLDSYALSAREYDFVVRMATTWKNDGTMYPVDLTSMPNFAFSAAYAQFKLSSAEASRQSLQQAVLKFPTVCSKMFEKLGESSDDASFVQSLPEPYLELLETLFVERTHELFKEPEVLAWFKENALAVTKQLKNTTRSLECEQHDAIPLSVSRHVVLTDIQTLLGFLPSSVTASSYHMYDPLPPSDSISGYDINDRMRSGGGAAAAAGGNGNFFENILETLLAGRRLPAQRMQEIRQLIEREMQQEGRLPGAFPEDGQEHPDIDEHLLDAVTQEDLEVQQLLADNVEQALQEQQQQPRQPPNP